MEYVSLENNSLYSWLYAIVWKYYLVFYCKVTITTIYLEIQSTVKYVPTVF